MGKHCSAGFPLGGCYQVNKNAFLVIIIIIINVQLTSQ